MCYIMSNVVDVDDRHVFLCLHDAKQRACRVRGDGGSAGKRFQAAKGGILE
jgi:hypothetical protein